MDEETSSVSFEGYSQPTFRIPLPLYVSVFRNSKINTKNSTNLTYHKETGW